MARLATCSIDRQQMEFFGIGHVKNRETGETVVTRWTVCTNCGATQQEDFLGGVLRIRTDKWTTKEIEETFPTEREKRGKKKK